jgi:hypothetical protein
VFMVRGQAAPHTGPRTIARRGSSPTSRSFVLAALRAPTSTPTAGPPPQGTWPERAQAARKQLNGSQPPRGSPTQIRSNLLASRLLPIGQPSLLEEPIEVRTPLGGWFGGSPCDMAIGAYQDGASMTDLE